MDVKDKVIIVTGASEGIGEASARLLAGRGAAVALVARSTDRIERLAGELRGAFPYTADMSHLDAVRAMIVAVHAHFGRIDVLINYACRGLHGTPVERIAVEQFRGLIELNVMGPLVAMQEVIPLMRRQGGGVIVNISSQLSRLHVPGLSAYAATKYMLNALTLTARDELAADNIRVCLVLPARTATRFQFNSLHRPGDPRQVQPSGDPAELVAQRILEAIESEAAEVLVRGEPGTTRG